jgi:phosphoglycerol transferase MdoB-like AlkP superfamily enzyme
MAGTKTLQIIIGHKSLMRRWNLLVTLRVYILALAIFSVFRLILFLTELDKVAGQPFITILKAFLMGVRFDIVVTGYIMLLPFVVLSVMQIARRHYRFVYTLVFLWVLVLFSLAFLICTADIPFFNHFFARFNTSAFLWMDSPSFVFKMILQEPSFSLYIIPFGIAAYLFYRFLRRAIAAPNHKTSEGYIGNIAIFILVSGLILVGIRGRVEKKSPIRVGTAYFCENAFLNQLGLNPVFTLMRSYLDDRKEEYRTIKLIDSDTAIRNVRGYLNLKPVNPDYPIARLIEPADNERSYNVVVIIMESMGLSKMAAGGNPNNLTPFLDSIASRGYFFNKIYTAGIHTFNGIFATICSFPCIYNQHHLKKNPISRYNGIGTTLKSMGYTTAYFTTHDGQFDNVEGFLRANDFDHVITQSDYPPEAVKTTLGVPDDYLFRFSIPIIDQYHAQGKPFLAVYMTASVHEPFYIPPYFKGQQIKEEDRIIEYADWSIRAVHSRSLNPELVR